MITVEQVLSLVEKQAQYMRENGPADMREMLWFVRGLREKAVAGKSYEEIADRFEFEEGLE